MIGKAREVYVYESPIDAMSHATLDVQVMKITSVFIDFHYAVPGMER